MLILYTVLCFAFQLVFWLVPNIVSSAVAFSLMGFLLGPFFAAVRFPIVWFQLTHSASRAYLWRHGFFQGMFNLLHWASIG